MTTPLIDQNAATRQKILGLIRRAQRRDATPLAQENEAIESYLANPRPGPRNVLSGELIDVFEAAARRLATTVDRVDSVAALPAAIATYLDAIGVARSAIVWPDLDHFLGAQPDWAACGITVAARAPVRDEPVADLVGITGVYAAVAETGTLALLSGPGTPASMALLPETHIAIVPSERIVGYYEDVFDRLRAEGRELPRALNFISGPSRTGDIEQTIVIGAHGPYRVHVIILSN
jgi:L-lactate dehydrogenase complex protein LldG